MINAFRHQRFLHPPAIFSPPLIKPGDQRLSASKIFARTTGQPVATRRRVINAFRHQRFLHVDSRQCVKERPIVINAFRHQRFLHHSRRQSGAGITPVINAFRHQRFLHLSKGGKNDRTHRSLVINAFRHQRFLHSLGRLKIFLNVVRDQRLSASKIFAPEVSRSNSTKGSGVINAFRHQRFLHARPLPLVRYLVLVINAFRHQRFLHYSRLEFRRGSILCDQRLSASKIFAPNRCLPPAVL